MAMAKVRKAGKEVKRCRWKEKWAERKLGKVGEGEVLKAEEERRVARTRLERRRGRALPSAKAAREAGYGYG